MTVLALILIGILLMSIIALSIGLCLDLRKGRRRDQEPLEVRVRALQVKRQLDADALRAAREIQDAIRRHGGQR